MLTEAEQKQLVNLLAKLNPGFYPYDIFIQLARLVTFSIIEFVPLRRNNGATEILLLERESNDDIWPGEVHTPGTVVRPTDNLDNSYLAFQRIRNDELKGTPVTEGHWVGNIFHHSKRGAEQAQVFWVEVLGEPKVGKFYSVTKLPDNLIESQKGFIMQAVRSFEKVKTT